VLDGGTYTDTATRLLDLLADPNHAGLSSREIARRLEIDHRYVGGFRAALAAVGYGPAGCEGLVDPGWGPASTARSAASAPPPSGTQSTRGHTIVGEPPAPNSWDCWLQATDRERTKFVDAVGLHHLLAAAPPDHRAAFLRDIGKA
jgi:hypothetical protein